MVPDVVALAFVTEVVVPEAAVVVILGCWVDLDVPEDADAVGLASGTDFEAVICIFLGGACNGGAEVGTFISADVDSEVVVSWPSSVS